jgi:FKBP-type peptidyl-prolyl cis-trans isomerase
MKITPIYFLFFILLSMFSCQVEGVDKKKEVELDEKQDLPSVPSSSKNKTLQPISTKDIEKFKNGLKIKWFKRGEGPFLQKEDVVAINFQVLLLNGELVDGNELLRKPYLPFLVGYGMQTKGWDLAFTHLKVGDFVEIYLPAALARGKHGVKGLIPPNSPNILRVKILKKMEPTLVDSGVKVWLLEENTSEKLLASEKTEVTFHYIVGTPTNPRYDISYRRNTPYRLRFSDFGIVKGLKKALINAKRSDKLWVVVPAEMAYGSKGLLDLVKPNEPVFYDIFVENVTKI